MEKRHLWAAAVMAAALWASAAPAYAENSPPPEPADTTETEVGDVGVYAPPPPPPPREPSLVGSSVDVMCVRDAPVISYRVQLTDPDDTATGHDAVLVITDGVNRVEIPLGDVSSGALSGTLLWPGASVDDAGNGTGWPGWEYRDGEWVEVDGNFAWTRDRITASIEVNPVLAVPLAYPPATSACASPTVTGTPLASGSTPLAATGGDAAAVAVVAGAAVGAVVIGGVLLLRRRRA
ncbi:LPXTG cell wall anchor domain-containing protein [Microbacterium sp. W1N]|uniref:LPXTG cell wall anchor domain-containing protein n=1 Tax=Microbacterium festucae TaxID=2977531 RepID=UPI0021BFDF36|nr:LPXTG cell wall anchor domain-containing protein [Microbacterium festucae]MCT9820049.1 LPXTG cell wall anchor domain-containing protein [Microbacterium festucae]